MKRNDRRSAAVTLLLVGSALFLASGAIARFLRSGPPPALGPAVPASSTSRAADGSSASRAANDAIPSEPPSLDRRGPLRAERSTDLAPDDAGGAELVIAGRLLDAAGAPCSGLVRLDLRPGERPAIGGTSSRSQIAAGADGRFAFAGDAPESAPTAVLLARADGQAPRVVLVAVERAARLDLGDVALSAGGGVFGEVADAAGRGIAGATVSLLPIGDHALRSWGDDAEVTAHATTGAGGIYEFANLAPGPYRLVAAARGTQQGRLRDPVVVEEGREIELLPLELAPGREIAGLVVDPSDDPVEGARVVALGRASGTRYSEEVVTDASGRFQLDHAPPVSLRLQATAPGFSGSDEIEVDDSAAGEIVLRLHAGLRIAGIVVDATTGAPVERFAARLRDGERDAPSLLDPLRRELRDLRSGRAARRPGAESIALELEIRRAAIEDAAATARPPRRPADLGRSIERPGGRFEFEGVEAGSYLLDVAPESHAFARVGPIEVGLDSSAAELRVEVHPARSVGGEIVRRADGAPLANAVVELVWIGDEPATPARAEATSPFAFAFARPGPRGEPVGASRTDVRGRFTIRNAPSGRCVLVASHGDAATVRSAPFELDRDRDDLRLELGALATLHGVVRVEPPGREREVRVLAVGGFGAVRSAEVLEDGTWRLEGLPAGEYVVRAWLAAGGRTLDREIDALFRDDSRPVAPDVALAEGEVRELELELTLPLTGAVAGSVTVNGESAPGLLVFLRAAAGGGTTLRTVPDRFGQFALREVPPGDYSVQIQSAAGRQELHRAPLRITASATSWVQATLLTGSVRARLIASDPAKSDQLEGTATILPGLDAAPADLRSYGRTNRVHSTRVRRGAFALEPVTAGPAFLVVDLRDGGRIETPIDVPVASRLELTLPVSPRR